MTRTPGDRGGAASRALLALGVVAAALLTLWVLGDRDAEPPSARQDAWFDTTLPWGTVVGRVLDHGGQGVGGATVLAQDLRGFGGMATTDASGAYRMTLQPLVELGAAWPGRRWARTGVPPLNAPLFLAAKHPDFVHTSLAEVEITRGKDHEAPPLTLWRGGVVRGRVTASAGGGPVPARVRVVGVAPAGPRPPGLEGIGAGHPKAWTQTEADGSFAIAGVAPGRIELWATAPGQGGGSAVATLPEGGEVRVRLVVDLQVHLAGRVVDAQGRAVAGVAVACNRESAPGKQPGRTPVREDPRQPGRFVPGDPRKVADRIRPFGRRPRSGRAPADDSALERARRRGAFRTTTDASGTFAFFAVDPGRRYTVQLVGASGHAGTVLTGLQPSRGDLILRMPIRRAVAGHIVSAADGAPIRGCVLQLLPAATASYLVRSLPLDRRLKQEAVPHSGDDGRFTIPDCFPGEHELLCIAPGFELARARVLVAGAGGKAPKPLEIRMEPGAGLRGRLQRLDGKPCREAWIAATAVRRGEGRPAPGSVTWVGRLRATAEEGGAFQLTGLPAGVPLRITARDADGGCFHVETEFSAGEVRETDVMLAAPSRMVVKLTPRGGGTRAGHRVRIQGIDDPSIDLEVHSDEDGMVRVKDVPPGRYRVAAVHPKEDKSRAAVRARILEVDLRSGQEVQLPIEVPDYTLVTGVVRVRGKSPAVARVGFGPIAGTSDHFEPLLLDVRQGRFTARIPPGTYHVNVNLPGKRFELPEPVVVPEEPTASLDLVAEEP